MIQMQEVGSTMFSHAGFDEPTKTLQVRFRESGKTYSGQVPPDVASDFLQSASLGVYFNRFLRKRYTFTEVL